MSCPTNLRRFTFTIRMLVLIHVVFNENISLSVTWISRRSKRAGNYTQVSEFIPYWNFCIVVVIGRIRCNQNCVSLLFLIEFGFNTKCTKVNTVRNKKKPKTSFGRFEFYWDPSVHLLVMCLVSTVPITFPNPLE